VLERRGNWRIIAEFTEVESGKRSNRPALDEAVTAAPVHQVPLMVAKVDRLTRSVAFLLRLLDRGEDPSGTTGPPIRRVPIV
jgi:DNA invertase Pin-like site-specific DNA recombinase